MTTEQPRPPVDASRDLAHRPNRRGYVLAAVMTTIFSLSIETTIVATAMPSIVPQLGDFHLYSWVFSAFLLTQAATTPIYGKLADLYGRRRVLMTGTTVFLLASVLCGFARSMPELIAFRALQGIGGGAIFPVALTIVGDLYPGAERARMQGYLSGTWGVSALAGPALGALIIEELSWPLIFWLNVPLGVAALVMLNRFYREVPRRLTARIDYLGAVLVVVGTGALMAAIAQGATLSAPIVIGLLGLAAAAYGGLIVHERRVPDPIVAFDLWGGRVILAASFGMLALGAAMIGLMTFLPTYMQGVQAASPAEVALAMAVMSVSWSLWSPVAGRFSIRTSFRTVIAVGAMVLFLTTAALAAVPANAGSAWVISIAFGLGAGLGFCHSPFIVAVQTSVEAAQRGTATSIVHFSRVFGQCVGAALFGGIVNAVVHSRAPAFELDIEGLMEASQRLAMAPAAVASLTAALDEASRYVFALGAALALMVVLIALTLPRGWKPGSHRPT